MKPVTNKTVYNPYAKEKCFHHSPQTSREEQENMKRYLEKTHKKQSQTLSLKCDDCGLSFQIKGLTNDSSFFLERYGNLDTITGRVYEIPCPLYIGVMGKIE